MNSGLIERIEQNAGLRFIDAETKMESGLSELVLQHELIVDSSKTLAFLYTDNSLQSISVLLGFLKSDHVVALLSPRLNAAFKHNLESLYTPGIIYDKSREQIPLYTQTVINDQVSLFQRIKREVYEIHPSVKVLLSTSGTTGSPKFVKLSSENLLSNALSILDYLPVCNDDVVPLNLPVYYSYGLSILTTNSIRGGKIICTNKDILNRAFWADLDQYKYSSLAGVPYVYEVLHRIGFTKKSYPSLRYLTQAGGRLNTELIKVFRDYARQHSLLFYVMYGQTEATARMSFLDPEYLDTKLGSIGKPVLNGSFYLDDDLNELCYKGPNVFGGYANDVKDLITFDSGQVLKTGDIARVDEDGFYYITGRMKRFVKIVGSRINLDEIESLLKNAFHEAIFYCMGMQDKYILVITDNISFDRNRVIDFLAEELALHRSFIKTEYLEKIPLTENGKINYTLIQQIHDAG